jgi:hypothetical protein
MKMIKVPKSVQGILVPKNFPEKHMKNPILVDRYIDPHQIIFKIKKKKKSSSIVNYIPNKVI